MEIRLEPAIKQGKDAVQEAVVAIDENQTAVVTVKMHAPEPTI